MTPDHQRLQIGDGRGLFPLALTPLENYLLLDGIGDAGAWFSLVVGVEGVVDRAALTAAIAFAGERHPLCLAKVQGYWRKLWSLDPHAEVEILWQDDGETPQAWDRPIDLSKGAGVRVLVEQRGGDATITMKFHHACCDGLGGAQWIEDLLTEYARQMGDADAPQPAPLEIERLRERGRRRVAGPRGWRWLAAMLIENYRNFLLFPRPLLASAAPKTRKGCFTGLVGHVFSEAETRQMRCLASAQGASLNDWLLTALFRALSAWNNQHGKRTSGDAWYRISMPINVRDRRDMHLPATNVFSLTFLQQRHLSIAGDARLLLRSVSRQSDEIQRQGRGALFLDGLTIGARIPGLTRLLVSAPWCLCTAILTNIGDPSRHFRARLPRHDGKLIAGNLLIRSLGGIPPLRRGTHVAISANTYRNRLTINLQMTLEIFGRADAERFLARFVGNCLVQEMTE
jgi:hypothetical protein